MADPIRSRLELIEPPTFDLEALERRVRATARRRQRRRRETLAVGSGLLAVALLVIGIVAWPGSGNRSVDVTTTPTGDPARSPFALGEPGLLAWVDAQDGLVVRSAPDQPSTALGPSGSWFPNLTLVPVSGTFALEWGGVIFRADPQRGLVAIGAGSAPFGSVDGQSFFVVTSFVPNGGATTIERRDVTGARIAGPWTLPSGWELAEINSGTSDIPRETTAGLLVESTSTLTEPSGWFGGRTLGLWQPGEPDVRELGGYRSMVGVGRGPGDHDDRIAFTRTGCDRQTGCDLEVLDLGTEASSVVSAPSPFGFVGGGAFSPDGSRLAAFVGSNSMGMNPAASLAIIDVASGSVQPIDGSEVSVGEPYGWATWDPDGSRVVFGSFTGDHALTVAAGEHLAGPLDGVPDAYSVSFLPG